MDYKFNPDLPFIKEDYKGNQFYNGHFTNAPWPDTDASLVNVLRWAITPNPQREEKKKDSYQPGIINADSIFEDSRDMIVWLGHATFFIRIGGISILTDPVLGNIPTMKRLLSLPTEAKKIKNIDYLFLSHAHRDHYDVPSLEKIIPQNPKMKMIGPLEIKKLTHRLIDRPIEIEEAGWYQQFKTDKIKISYLPALHWNKRGLNDFNTVLWGSCMIEYNGFKIFFAGDTAYGTHFTQIKNTLGKPDICIMPIGAYKPSFLMKQSHMDPLEAIKAFHDLEGKIFIPMHFGTFDLANEPISEPIRLVRENLPSDQLKELKPGEVFLIKTN